MANVTFFMAMLQIPGNMTRKSKSNIHHKNVALFPTDVTSATKIATSVMILLYTMKSLNNT